MITSRNVTRSCRILELVGTIGTVGIITSYETVVGFYYKDATKTQLFASREQIEKYKTIKKHIDTIESQLQVHARLGTDKEVQAIVNQAINKAYGMPIRSIEGDVN